MSRQNGTPLYCGKGDQGCGRRSSGIDSFGHATRDAPGFARDGPASGVAPLHAAVIGMEIEEQDLYTIGKRVYNLQRAIHAREGRIGRASDVDFPTAS